MLVSRIVCVSAITSLGLLFLVSYSPPAIAQLLGGNFKFLMSKTSLTVFSTNSELGSFRFWNVGGEIPKDDPRPGMSQGMALDFLPNPQEIQACNSACQDDWSLCRQLAGQISGFSAGRLNTLVNRCYGELLQCKHQCDRLSR